MGVALVIGCLVNTFATPLAVYVIVIARDPLRVILFVLGMFFWLLSLLLASFVWTAAYPLRDQHIWFALFFTVVFQEMIRVAYFYLLKFAEAGLMKVAGANGIHVTGVHSLVNARHTLALVCGLGYGVMGGLLGITNIAADSGGPGAPGLPNLLGHKEVGHPYYFAALSSIFVSAMIMLQVAWTVIMWNGLHHWRLSRDETLLIASGEPAREPHYLSYVEMATVVFTHFLVVFCSLLNEANYWPVYMLELYSVLIFSGVWALKISGVTLASLIAASKNVQWRRPSEPDLQAMQPPRQAPQPQRQPHSSSARETEVRQRSTGGPPTTQVTSEPTRC